MTDNLIAHYDPADLYRLLVESVRDYAIFVLDATGHVVTWNEGARRLKGYEPHEIIGKHFSIFYPPEKVAEGFPQYELAEAARDGRFEDEGWRVRKDGTRFWANVVITALRDPAGRLVGYAKVTRDLTERRRMEDRIRLSEERFRLLVQGVRDYGIFMLDLDGNVASWNEGAERIKGYTAEEIIGRHFSVFYPPEERASGRPQRELERAAREGRFEEEGWRVRKDGSRFWANVVVTALRDATGRLVGYAKVTRDLTERRAAEDQRVAAASRLAAEEAARVSAESQAEELRMLADQLQEQALELEEQTRQAEHANRAKSDFLAAMSHELRTPLNAIGGYADLLLLGVRGDLPDVQRDDLERIRRSQQHLLGVINDILNFSRIEAGQVTYDVTAVPLREVLDGVVPMIEPQAAARSLRFEVSCTPSVSLCGDLAKVQQILLNLLSNAVKFTSAGGRVEVSCAADTAMVTIVVRDTGAGIPADKLDAIFEPFVQVGRSLTRPTEGTGLGLAISRDLARGMGGDLTVTSIEGRGSTFTLVLPRA